MVWSENQLELIFVLTFLREEKVYKRGKADEYPLTQLLPTASIALYRESFFSMNTFRVHTWHTYQHNIHDMIVSSKY
jgi:hypothetical protein